MPPTRSSTRKAARRRQKPRPREFCTYPECKEKPPITHLKRHVNSFHNGEERIESPCFFCNEKTTDSTRSGHIERMHKPKEGIIACPGCHFAWPGRPNARRNHQKVCVLFAAGHWIFSQTLGIYVRPDFEPKQYFRYYEYAESVNSRWASSLPRTVVEAGESRLELLEAEVKRARAAPPVSREGGVVEEPGQPSRQPASTLPLHNFDSRQHNQHYSPVQTPATDASNIHHQSYLSDAPNVSTYNDFAPPIQHNTFTWSPFAPVPVPLNMYHNQFTPFLSAHDHSWQQPLDLPNDQFENDGFYSHLSPSQFPGPYYVAAQSPHHYSSLSHRKATIYGMLNRLII